ncbi:MAG: sigma-70 family RNA polymerase sigma factor [Dermatophilaceae bacterium]|nr:sigma-70 family RNA polymerase sigma factor [Dermatophilaceae bacterium]
MRVTDATRPAHLSGLPAPPSGPAISTGIVELEALFASYGAACHALARTVLRDVDFAQDVVQEAFLEHWRNASFDATRSTHRSWLLMLTHRKAVDRVRYEQRRKSLSLEAAPELVSTLRGPDDLALAAVLAPRVRAALVSLPRVQREVLALAFWGGCTQREVAEITRAPLGTVKTRMRNGMISLRLALVDERG